MHDHVSRSCQSERSQLLEKYWVDTAIATLLVTLFVSDMLVTETLR